MGHGWAALAFWVATVYSIWAAVVPIQIQKRAMLAAHIDPTQRLAIWGFGLAVFFLYAGFRAWDEERAIVERTSEGAMAKELGTLRAELDEIHSHEWPRLTEVQKIDLAERLRRLGGRTIWIIRPNKLDCIDLARDFDGVFREALWDVPNVEPYSPGNETLGITIQTLMDVGPALQAAIVETTGFPARIYEIPAIERKSWSDDHVVLSIGLKS
jgi:hypothetical protein